MKLAVFCAALALGRADDLCSWCEGGACNDVCKVAKAHFSLSITKETGKFYPYWVPADSAVQDLQTDEVHPEVELAVMMHHGAVRNGNEYLCYIYNSVVETFGKAFADKKVVIFAPQVYYPEDKPADKELFWDPQGVTDSSSWSWGGNSTGSVSASLSSFEVIDELLGEVSNKARFPHLKKIVVAGHSSGGQITHRYAMANRVDEEIRAKGLDLHYFPANPSNFAYLDETRPVLPTEVTCDSLCNNRTLSTQKYKFADAPVGPGAGCKDYNKYGYGLEGGLVPYMQSVGVKHMLAAYGKRQVTYLSGDSDICNKPEQDAQHCTTCTVDDGGLEVSCSDYAQGWCRMERAHAYLQHVRNHYGRDVHDLVQVPFAGHNGCAMVQSPATRRAMFGTLDEVTV